MIEEHNLHMFVPTMHALCMLFVKSCQLSHSGHSTENRAVIWHKLNMAGRPSFYSFCCRCSLNTSSALTCNQDKVQFHNSNPCVWPRSCQTCRFFFFFYQDTVNETHLLYIYLTLKSFQQVMLFILNICRQCWVLLTVAWNLSKDWQSRGEGTKWVNENPICA